MKHTDVACSCTRTVFAHRQVSRRAMQLDSARGGTSLRLLGAALVAALAATSCAFVYEGKYDWQQGWREAQVVKTGNAAALGERQFSDCRYGAETEQAASGQFVMLSYLQMGHMRHRVVPLHEGEAYRSGDLVYMNIQSCHTPLVTRTGTEQK